MVADFLSEAGGDPVPTLVVDSMQVYREIPTITNQQRRRPAELVGVASVTEEWTVARHRDLALEKISASGSGRETAAVLDAGTGMYLNAILLDIPLAPKVDPALRELAAASTAGAPNPRRAARARELDLAGATERGSVWEGDLRYDVTGVYLRPERALLDARIEARSREIVREGLRDAKSLQAMIDASFRVNASVLDSIGVRELLAHLRGESTLQGASAIIAARTRRLARRQMRWFDKLLRTLEGRATLKVAPDPSHPAVAELLKNTMHDII